MTKMTNMSVIIYSWLTLRTDRCGWPDHLINGTAERDVVGGGGVKIEIWQTKIVVMKCGSFGGRLNAEERKLSGLSRRCHFLTGIGRAGMSALANSLEPDDTSNPSLLSYI